MNITGRDSDRIALQEFSRVMNDFHFDAPEGQTELSVTYGDRGKKWIKRMKKLDPFWDANLFISNLFLQSMQKALEDAKNVPEEKVDSINNEKTEEKTIEVNNERSSD